MDYDKIAEIMKDENVMYSEVSRYITKSDGSIIRETVYIDYYSQGDYQWTISMKPISPNTINDKRR
jgi:hypothetical protein